MLIFILIFIVGILYYVYQYYRMRGLPPYIDGAWPIIGHCHKFVAAKNLHQLIADISKLALAKGLDIFSIKFGIWNVQVVLDPDDAGLILSTYLEKDTLYDYVKPALGNGLLNAKVPIWKIYRKLLNPTFNQQVLDGYIHEFNNHTRQLIDDIAVHVGKGPFDQFKYLSLTSLESVLATAMGSNIEDNQTKQILIKGSQEYMTLTMERVRKAWLQIDFIYTITGHKKRQEELLNKLKDVGKEMLKQKQTEFRLRKQQFVDTIPEKRFKTFIELLLELSENGELDDQQMFDEYVTFVMAGSETTAVTISNALTCIGTYGAVQDRIFEELQEVFDGSYRDVEKHDLPKLKYLDAVLKETMRLYPPVIMVGRNLDKELKIKGYTIPTDSRVYIHVYGILRHQSWGPDADTFRPERWFEASLPNNLKGWAFGYGKRSCIGTNYALMFMKTFLTGILRRYSVKSDASKIVQECTIVSKPISGHEISIENNKRYERCAGSNHI